MPITPATPIPADSTNIAAITALNSFLEPLDASAVSAAGMRIFHFLKILLIRPVLFSKPLKFNYTIKKNCHDKQRQTEEKDCINKVAATGRQTKERFLTENIATQNFTLRGLRNRELSIFQ